MKISLNWLKEYVPDIKKNDIFIEELTSLGLEVSSQVKIKKDTIIDIDMTPNRADCLSILGVARDISPLYKKKICLPKSIKLIKAKNNIFSMIERGISPSYSVLSIQNIDNSIPTPEFMKQRLTGSGIKTVNFIVDVLNYVMLENGQPMHAFDKDKFNGPISVRFAKKNEKMSALDGQVYRLTTDTPVISDSKNPQAIAGIIGSGDTAVSVNSKNIFIESAYFTPTIIRRSSKNFRLQTDASYRFERGVDPLLNKYALERVLFILKEHTKVGNYSLSHSSVPKVAKHIGNSISVESDLFQRSLGVKITNSFIMQTLKYLGFNPKKNKSSFVVKVPSHRFDIQLPQDLVEEVARVYGYNNFKSVLAVNSFNNIQAKSDKNDYYSDLLVARGYNETISFSFIPSDGQINHMQKSQIIKIINPISEDKSEMRGSMINSILSTCGYNFSRNNNNLKIFESGKTYKKHRDGKVTEENILAGAISGINSEQNLKTDQNELSFFDLKGDLISMLPNLSFEANDNIKYISKTCQAVIKQNNQIIGYCGEPSSSLCQQYSIKNKVYYYELMMDKIIHIDNVKYKKISVFPKIKRDLTILVDNKILASEIIDAVERKLFNYMINSKINDIFYNKAEFGKDKKSITVEFIFQDSLRTLIDNQVNVEMEKITNLLMSKYKAIIRT
ncbi:MAG: phenylalanine--tRNA ligase subunit beta [Gammaproteobacteria bacterium]|jgi:phenylalanyl-tRNA synthetase beta chain|nr:phenylalanine--tRNA ligase subunit beta [Gammaproteobacteria bacterium]MBT4655147.1 phenylalanine--tRNA ligase subunit beta [Gammaproteobacteria bacterium]MBT5116752.1 phenylalanine--tRNA ligase subunit beta [Gammaproteobacteria bacterium]MBT5761399.1 phenylalanine--tRNA ligase subunit beta [Gammaproteobacteria bacterium]MBT6331962.1 phenylalanine--tRNA ligase subunit beta [Gammaproteobacteria bacterium]